MKQYKITVNGTEYEVAVEEVGGTAATQPLKRANVLTSGETAALKQVLDTPAPKAAPASKPAAAGSGDVVAPLNGSVLSVAVKEGDAVKVGQVLLVFEAMKMENEIAAPRDGTVKKVHVAVGAKIETGMPVVTIG